MNSNVLILVPGDDARGGITNYYKALRKHLPKNFIYFKRGARNWPKRSNPLVEFIRIITDYLRFLYKLIYYKISIVQTTTAFYKRAIIRDGIFILIARILGKKIVVFFRGWNDQYAHGLSGISLKLFKFVYFSADAIIDLSEDNINFLKRLGYNKALYLETTVVDDNLLTNSSIASSKSVLFF